MLISAMFGFLICMCSVSTVTTIVTNRAPEILSGDLDDDVVFWWSLAGLITAAFVGFISGMVLLTMWWGGYVS